MPDDPIFDSPSGDPPADPPADPTPPANGGTGPSAEQIAEMVSSGIERAMTPFTAQLERMNPATPPAPPAPDPTPEVPFLDAFAQDPEKAIDQRVGDQLKQIAPVLNTMISGGHSAFTGIEAEEVDRKFGTGAWDKYFATPLEKIWDAYRAQNPSLLADRTVIQREVNGLKGQLLDELVDHRDESRKTKEAADLEALGKVTGAVTEEVVNRTNSTGGFRRMDTNSPDPATLESVKGYLEERTKAIGGEEAPKDFLKRTGYGNTLKDYQEHQKTLKGSE